jgi:hypothetical protein
MSNASMKSCENCTFNGKYSQRAGCQLQEKCKKTPEQHRIDLAKKKRKSKKSDS